MSLCQVVLSSLLICSRVISVTVSQLLLILLGKVCYNTAIAEFLAYWHRVTESNSGDPTALEYSISCQGFYNSINRSPWVMILAKELIAQILHLT